MADDDAKDGEEKKPSMIKSLLVPLVTSLIAAGATVGGLGFMGVVNFGEQPPVAEAGAMEGGENGGEMAAGSPAFFFTFYPDMLIRLPAGKKSHYLKLSVEVMSRQEEVVTGIEQYQPIIRNNLLKMFQEVDHSIVMGPNGVEELQIMAAEEIREVLKKYHGNDSIEGVYFSSFVVQ